LRDTSGASIKVPRFTDILTGVGAQTIHIIEPKAKNIAGKIIDLVQEHGLLSNVRFNTDDLGVAREITAREPGAIVGFVTEDPTFTPDQVPNLAGAGVSYLSSWASLTPRPLVDACHANGLEVRPYFKGTQVLWTKGMRNEVLRLRDMGVDGVIVNHPQEVRRLVEMSTETIARIRPQLAA
jgi:glycerophosphoryl diester phosphodiesterase